MFFLIFWPPVPRFKATMLWILYYEPLRFDPHPLDFFLREQMPQNPTLPFSRFELYFSAIVPNIFFQPLGGVRFRFCWLAVYQFLEFLVIVGTCASQFARQGRDTCAKRLYESRVMPFSVRKPSRLGLLRKSVIPRFLYFEQKQQSHFLECPFWIFSVFSYYFANI